MKHIFYFLILFLSFTSAFSQAPFWTEDFGTGCDQDQSANGFDNGNGPWSLSNNSPGSDPNEWYVSSKEGGQAPGICGADECGNTDDRTLHVGLAPFVGGDIGAYYDVFFGFSETDSRIESPVIDCSGQSNIKLEFEYILEGLAGIDFMDVQYSPDAGVTWSIIAIPPPTANGGCGGQGLWTTYSLTLPTSANNNSLVVIGFRWFNNDPGGSGLSTAIDDIALVSGTFAPTFTLATPLCIGNTTTVTANTGGFVSTYTWTAAPAGPVIASPNASVTTINFPTSGTFSITLSATSGGTTATNVQTVIVNPTPVLTASATTTLVCSGHTVGLSVTGANSYTWQPVFLVGGNIVDSPVANTTYTVYGMSLAGCTASTTLGVSISNFTFAASASPSAICGGSSSTLSASGGTAYTWNPGALTGSVVSVTPAATENYTVTATSAIGCTASAIRNVSVTPNFTLTATATPSTITAGATSTLTGGSATSYSWNPGSLAGSIVTVTPGATTIYTVTGVTGGCVKTKTVTVIVTGVTGLNNYTNNSGNYIVFPNPTSDQLFIQSNGNSLTESTIMVVDALGKTIIKQTHTFNTNTPTHSVNVNSIPAGMYFVKIISEKETKVIRFIKE